MHANLFRRAALAAALAAGLFAPPAPGAPAKKPAAAKPTPAPAKKVWVCPPCGEDADKVEYDKPGSCPSCGMALVEKAPAPPATPAAAKPAPPKKA